ncbi:hypothetical protein DPEC_G00374750 [Dallia pectoralis]|nr:hypothetical protein DPEC_G00374750 [Dallia pectoralis]
MAARTRYRTDSSEDSCPVAALLVFHKQQLEFRGAYYNPSGGDPLEMGLGATEHHPGPRVRCQEADNDHLILKATLPVTIALFSTVLTKEFGDQYDVVERGRGVNMSSSRPSFAWMAKIFELAEVIQFSAKAELHSAQEMSSVVRDAVLKSTVAIATLFTSRSDTINRFMRKVARKYADKHIAPADFYTMVVMLALCFFPYLKHRVLGDLFNNKTLVLMCFDKTRTRHSQWSTLSTYIHLHANQPEFVNRVLSGSDLGTSLPIVVTVTLDKYMSDASYPENQKCTSHGLNPRVLSVPLASFRVTNQTDTRPDASYHEYERCMSHGQNPPGLPVASPGVPNQTETQPGSLLHFTKRGTPVPAGKRRTSCSPGYFETHEGRQEEKMMRLQNS